MKRYIKSENTSPYRDNLESLADKLDAAIDQKLHLDEYEVSFDFQGIYCMIANDWRRVLYWSPEELDFDNTKASVNMMLDDIYDLVEYGRL